MKKLHVDIDAILVSLSKDDLIFQKDVIHNLYRINNQLNYELTIIVEG